MRDTHATGIGSIMGAGTAGYCVGNLQLDGMPLPGEDPSFPYPESLASPLQVGFRACLLLLLRLHIFSLSKSEAKCAQHYIQKCSCEALWSRHMLMKTCSTPSVTLRQPEEMLMALKYIYATEKV